MKRWAAAAPLLVLALAVVLFAVYALKRPTAQVAPEALVGQAVPPVLLPGLDGAPPRALSAVARGPALINVFASWCAPCAVEHPQLIRLQARGVRIVGVAYKDAPAKAAAFLARLGDPFAEVLTDADGRAGIELGISGVPETFAVDAAGKIVAKHSGPLTTADADRLATALGMAD